MDLKEELTRFGPHLFSNAFQNLLEHPEAFLRRHLPHHFTGSGFILNRARTHIVLLFHRKLGRWLQPGGHADGETDLLQVARKEIEEETGLRDLILLQSHALCSFVDLDIHTIPQSSSDPKHEHFDVRFAFEAPGEIPLMGNSESKEVRWWPLAESERLIQEQGFQRFLKLVEGLKRA